jgi:phosphatidylglycerol:prolipoprotein diacylglycerol transferase
MRQLAIGLPLLEVGGLALRPTGLLASAGLLLGLTVALRAARRDGLDPGTVARLVALAGGFGLVGGHLVHLLAYHPEELTDGWALLRLGDGLSSIGGLAGGVAGALLALRGRRPGLTAYGDALALGLAPGWALARVGCALVHDHPGRLTSVPWAVDLPGGPRHDLGAYEAAWLGLLTLLLVALRRRPAWRSRLLPTLAVGYGAVRFLLDFWRATDLPGSDPRHLGLTAAQWGCLLLVGWGLAALRAPRAV